MFVRLFFLLFFPYSLFGMNQSDPQATIPVTSSGSSQSVYSSISSAPPQSTRSIASQAPAPAPASSSKRSSLGAIFRAVGFASRSDSPGKKARKEQAEIAASCCDVDPSLGSDSDFALHLHKNFEKLSPEQRQLVQNRMQEMSNRNSVKQQ